MASYIMVKIFQPIIGNIIIPVFGRWGVGGTLPPDFSPDSALLLFCDGTNTDGTHKTDLINGYDMTAVEGPCLTLAIGDSIEMIGHGTFTSNTGTATFDTYDGTDLTCNGAGTAFELKFSDDTVWPCSEGAGDAEDNVTIHATTGQHSGTITVADTPLAMWTDNTQDVYMDGHDRGWHEIETPDDDGIYYPADPNTQEIFNLALEVTGLGTVTIDGNDYTVGSHQLTDLTGSVAITAAYGLDEDALDWSGGDTVTGDYPDYSVDMSTSMSITATFSELVTLLVDEDFEGTGAPSGWTGNMDFDYATDPAPLVGTYSCATAGGNYASSPLFAAQSHIFAGFQFQITTLDQGSVSHFFRFKDGSGNAIGYVGVGNDSKIYIKHGTSAEVGSVSAPISVGTKYYIWVEMVKSTGSDGVLKVWVGTTGVLASATLVVETSAGDSTADIEQIQLCVLNSTISGVIIFDNVKAADTQVGDM